MKKILSATWLKIAIVAVLICVPIGGVLVYADNAYRSEDALQVKNAPTPSLIPTDTPTPTTTEEEQVKGTTSSSYKYPADVPVVNEQKVQHIVLPTHKEQEKSEEKAQYITPTAYPTNTPIPAVAVFVSPEIEAALSKLNQILTDIENQPVAMNVIEGRKQKAYQDWVNNNNSIYSLITATRYKGNLNGILTVHGLSQYSIY